MEIKRFLYLFAFATINVGGAILMDFAARQDRIIFALLLFSFALFLNIVKFVYWGWILKLYTLSSVYPMTGLFFPLIYLVAVLKGEAPVTLLKIIGVTGILSGVLLLSREEE